MRTPRATERASKTAQRTGGFSLAELVVAMAIVLMLGVFVMQGAFRATEVWGQLSINTDMAQSLRKVVDEIGRDVRGASQLLSGSKDDQILFLGGQGQDRDFFENGGTSGNPDKYIYGWCPPSSTAPEDRWDPAYTRGYVARLVLSDVATAWGGSLCSLSETEAGFSKISEESMDITDMKIQYCEWGAGVFDGTYNCYDNLSNTTTTLNPSLGGLGGCVMMVKFNISAAQRRSTRDKNVLAQHQDNLDISLSTGFLLRQLYSRGINIPTGQSDMVCMTELGATIP